MKKILIVEDDRAVQKALKRLVESEGYSIDIRADGHGRDYDRRTPASPVYVRP